MQLLPLRWSSREKKRVEARRSVSLTQADVLFYEGVVTSAPLPSSVGAGVRMQSPSPQRAVEDKYRDYYENKYDKPIERGVDVDTVWKSRWRSTSPPPPLVDDWVPIKPPHLAWAKAITTDRVDVITLSFLLFLCLFIVLLDLYIVMDVCGYRSFMPG